MAARHRKPSAWRATRPETVVPWVPALVGVGIMAGYLIYAVTLPVDSDRAAGAPETGLVPDPPPLSTPALVPSPAPAPSVGVEVAAPRRAHAPRPSPSPSPPPPPPALAAEYRLDARFRHGFIASVTVVNPSREPVDWTVELSYPSDVGELNAYWVDGHQQPRVDRDGDTYVFTGAVPLDPDVRLVLRVHFDRDGRDIDPTRCVVDGAACAR